jgi:hypothetical protein
MVVLCTEVWIPWYGGSILSIEVWVLSVNGWQQRLRSYSPSHYNHPTVIRDSKEVQVKVALINIPLNLFIYIHICMHMINF